jgi:putative inorganic carbon (HCO3(-)) transporter
MLFFLVPLILWPFTSEVFEFNKMVVVYIFTTLIVATWLTRTVLVRKFIFRRTILDIPLLVFLGSQLISTVLSIDPSTSWFGYYSRFNGGLLSVICYSLLYWAFVSNLDRKSALRTLYTMLISATLVSVYGVLEHFGIDKNIWVQDVQSRVFSTLGQPNWLSAWLVALIPVTWTFALNSKTQISNFKQTLNTKSKILNIIPYILSILYFWTLIFTKSRSGLLGFGVAFLLFWGFVFWSKRKQIGEIIKPFAIICSSILVISLVSGTQFTPSIASLLSNQVTNGQASAPQGTALETGGTESGTIRKIVWKGAVQVWLHYPIFGSGVETFAYSYYMYRPTEHNSTSEWDFIYNKAHNEFLNIAANSGTIGLFSYLFLKAVLSIKLLKITNHKNQITNKLQITI